MASLAERLAAEAPQSRKGPPCSVAAIFPTLTADDAQALADAIELIRGERATGAHRHSVAWLARALNDPTVSRQSLARHIKRECSCESR